jgi:hypothetical protein
MTEKLPSADDATRRDGSRLSEGLGPNACMQATPRRELMAQLMNPNVPKSEREHAAVREIERLREHAVVLAATVEAVERERCAQLCEQWDATHPQRLAALIRTGA